VNIKEKQTLTWRVALIAGIFSAIVSIIMILNYWQLQRSKPLENDVLVSLVEQLKKEPSNDQLKENIRRVDLMVRKAYFTKQWQIRAGAFLLIGGAVILVISLRMHHSYSSRLEEPGSEDRHLGRELLATQQWMLYSILIIFGLALIAAWISNDQLSNAYTLTTSTDESEEIEEIMIRTGEGAQEQPLTNEIENLDTQEPDVGKVVTGQEMGNQDSGAGVKDIGESAGQGGTETATGLTEDTETMEKSGSDVKSETLDFLKQYPSFRGPNGLGTSVNKNIPVDWDGPSGRNVLWKSEIPLTGYNSPVLWGSKIFLTGASDTEQFIYCINRENGAMIWQHAVNDISRPGGGKLQVTDDTGYAAPTVVTNGNLVCAIFATGDVVCVDMEGNRKWSKGLGIPDNHYGHSSSLLIYQNLLLVQFDTNKGGKIMGLDLATGDQKWATARPSKISWASPVLATVGNQVELILSSSPHVAAYNPLSGTQLWALECLTGEVGPSPAYADGIVYVANEYAVLAAIKPGNPPEILWETNEYLPEVSSPVAKDGMVFLGTSYGVIVCYNASDGEILWEYECDEGIYASPIIVDNKVYFLDIGGKMHIFNLSKTLQLLGEPELGEGAVSTPAFSDGRIYLRGDKFLYCIGK
jgi:outer membrane protein assembly factor BamB